MSRQKTIPSPEDEQYLKEMGEYFLSLSIDDLAMVLRNPVSQDDAIEAANRMPQLMEHVHEAFEAMPSPLTLGEEQSAFERGASLAKRMFAKPTPALISPLAGAWERIAGFLGIPLKAVETMCLGWSDPSRQVAMAAGGSLELRAKLDLGTATGGQITLEVNRFGVAFLKGEFDRPASVTVFLFDLLKRDVVPFTIDSVNRTLVAIKARTTKEALVHLPELLGQQNYALVVLASQEETK